MKRSEARVLLMQMLYEMDIHNDFGDDRKNIFLENNNLGNNQVEYFNKTFELIRTNKDEIDEVINESSKKWSISTMAKVDVAALRLATAELLFTNDAPKPVVINEAIELGKQFGGDNSGRFINGVLGSMVRKRNE